MSTIGAPASFNVSGNDYNAAGLVKAFELTGLEMAMMDKLDPIANSIVQLKVDFAGRGTDTLRIPYVDNVGYSRQMSSLASEVATITASTLTTGYSTISIGLYGLAHTTTQKAEILMQPGTVLNLQQLMALVPDSFLGTLRNLACAQGAAISTAIGSASVALGEDDIYALAAAMVETPGSTDRGAPLVILAPQQMTQLRTSLRSSPAFIQNLQAYLGAAGAPAGTIFRNFMGLGFDVMTTEDVDTSGGAYQGFAFAPGGIGYAVASTSRLAASMPAAAEAMFLDQYGLVINRKLDGLTAATNGYEARAYVGCALGNSLVYFQRRLISVV